MHRPHAGTGLLGTPQILQFNFPANQDEKEEFTL